MQMQVFKGEIQWYNKSMNFPIQANRKSPKYPAIADKFYRTIWHGLIG